MTLGAPPSVLNVAWPSYDEEAAREEMLEIPIQLNGKVRSRILSPPGAAKEELERRALEEPRIREILGERTPARVVVVPDRLVNIVLKG